MSVSLTNALSGMNVARLRVDVAAANIANAGDESAPDAPPAYTPQRVEQQSVPSGGVSGRAVSVDPTSIQGFDPDSSASDDKGAVQQPNVDLATQLSDVLAAKQAYTANLKVAEAASDMEKKALDIGRHASVSA